MQTDIHSTSYFCNPSFRKPIFYWLLLCTFMVACMVTVGGYTRLSGSGLSITEWKPLHGTLPPLNETEWLEEFELYKQIPQYAAINAGMTLDAFKDIYWPEFWHRNLGRLLGIVFFIPFVFFAAKRAFSKPFALKLLGIFALGGLQGTIGWIMVASGLEERVYVSHIKLALHLGTAFVIFGLLLKCALDVHSSLPHKKESIFPKAAVQGFAFILGLLFLQILFGALTAGLHAGLLYPTYPLMDGYIIPPETFDFQGLWIDNPILIQFIHRTLALAIFMAVVLWWFFHRKSVMQSPNKGWWKLFVLALAAQIGLGILTLIKAVPMVLALKHQQLGLILFGLAVVWFHCIRRERHDVCV